MGRLKYCSQKAPPEARVATLWSGVTHAVLGSYTTASQPGNHRGFPASWHAFFCMRMILPFYRQKTRTMHTPYGGVHGAFSVSGKRTFIEGKIAGLSSKGKELAKSMDYNNRGGEAGTEDCSGDHRAGPTQHVHPGSIPECRNSPAPIRPPASTRYVVRVPSSAEPGWRTSR